MRIRIWNAFASNNSGSYTIVGSFPSPEDAADVATELASLMRAHTDWREAERAPGESAAKPESPLQAFAKKHGLTWEDGLGTSDDWPEHSQDNAPQAFAVDEQVIIHHHYTVSLPRMFGQYFYARGGRVEHELNHAHHPIVAVFELWIPWEERRGVDVAAKARGVLAALQREDGPLVACVEPGSKPAWRASEDLHDAPLTLGAVFEDLLAGFTGVEQIAREHGFRANVKVFEAWDKSDPLAFLRTPTAAPKP